MTRLHGQPAIFGVRQVGLSYRIRHAAYAVIFGVGKRVACVGEDAGLFLPGGGIEPGEDALRALHREVGEECGRTIEVISPLEDAVQFFLTAAGEPYELRASFFLARFTDALSQQGHLQMSWHLALPDPPPLFHECHRWAVGEAVRGSSVDHDSVFRDTIIRAKADHEPL